MRYTQNNNNRQVGRGNTQGSDGFFTNLRERFNGWRLGISLDADTIIKGVIIAIILVALTLLQTTLLTKYRPFGMIPDLILPFVITVGVLERERWGAVVALIAAYVIDAAGGSTVMLLPLLYVPAAFAVGILTTHRFRDSFPVMAMYTVVGLALRGVITFIIASVTIHGVSPSQVFTGIVVPEFFASLILSPLPQLITRLCLRPFHKTRAERTGNIITTN